MSTSRSSGSFKFRKHDNIGAADAEDDIKFLHNCFVDTGDLETITDINDHRFILVGRTGSGKTALLMRIKETLTNVISLSLNDLAIEHVSKSKIFHIAESTGSNLYAFYSEIARST